MKNFNRTKKLWLFGTVAAFTLTACSSGDAKLLKEAETAVTNGNYAVAADLYSQVSNNSASDKNRAKIGIKKLVNVSKLSGASTEDLSDILEAYNSFNFTSTDDSINDVYNMAVERINAGEADNTATHDLLHAAQDLGVETPQDLSEKDFALITVINEDDPENLLAASELGEVFYNQGDIESAKKVLLPIKDKLGDSEGARVLGQVFVAEGNNKEAYPLLSAYTSSRLKTFQAAEKAFGDLQTSLWDDEFSELQEGNGPQSFYDTYDAASEDEQQLVVDNYIGEKIDSNLAYQAALFDYREAAAIVPVVMDFGILQLRNAETMSSESERKTELKAAEETFLSIRNVAGDTDDYKIYLGQVYFWLGKQDEGQALFNEVIDRSGRDPLLLLNVASTLRNLGKVGLASELSQEAYENGKDDETRHYAANMMQLLSPTVEEKIKWLERGDLTSSYGKASLADNKGHLAAQNGQDQKAAKYYREAIQYMEGLPEDAGSFNNTALTYFSLHRVTGDQDAYSKGVNLMSKAVELAPDQAILLSNSASTLVTNSFYETLGDSIDYKFLKATPSFDTVRFYYSNETEKAALREKLGAHPDMIKATDYYERSILLSPNNISNYTQLQQIYGFMNDAEGMTALLNKMKGNQVDVSASQQSYIDFVNGKTTEADLIKMQEQEKTYKKLQKSRNINKQTRAVLHANLSENLSTQSFFGASGLEAEVLLHAEKSYELMPSSATRNAVSNALMALANAQAIEKFPAYKALTSKVSKTVSPATLALIAMNKDDEVSAWLKSNKEMQRAIAMEAKDFDDFPLLASAAGWNTLSHAEDKSLAGKMIERIKSNKLNKATREMKRISSPYTVSGIIDDHLLGQIDGFDGVSQERLDKLSELGIALPTELLQ